MAVTTRLIYLFAFMGLSYCSIAQKTDLGMSLGTANYLGELAPDIAWNESKWSASFFVRNRLSKFFALKHSLSLARISGNDANFRSNRLRNLSFKSNILEVASVVEFNFLPFGTEKSKKEKAFTTYVFAGLGIFRYNPKSSFGGKTVELKSIGTEGQGLDGGKSYSLIGVSLPFGMGFKWNITRKLLMSWEVGFRGTFTDYIDDVSNRYPDFVAGGQPQSMQLSDRSGEVNGGTYLAAPGDIRGNPKNKDWYVFSGVSLAFRIIPPQFCKDF